MINIREALIQPPWSWGAEGPHLFRLAADFVTPLKITSIMKKRSKAVFVIVRVHNDIEYILRIILHVLRLRRVTSLLFPCHQM